MPLRKKEPRWLLFRSSLGCTMTIERWLKEEKMGSTHHESVEGRQRVIVVGQDAFKRRPLALLSRFLECML